MRPEELQDLGEQEKQETDKNMEEMWEVLKKCGGRCVLLGVLRGLSRGGLGSNVRWLEVLIALAFGQPELVSRNWP